jgi:lipoprotein NlpD
MLLGPLVAACAGSHRDVVQDPRESGATALRDVPTDASTKFDWPIADGKILSGFGVLRGGHRHKGIDIRGKAGQPVRAARTGRIVYSGSSLRGYGKTVIIDHGDDLQSLYAHNSTLLVTEGQRVARGQVIARVGRTGNASTEHCHFEIRRRDVAVDPLQHLGGAMGSAR